MATGFNGFNATDPLGREHLPVALHVADAIDSPEALLPLVVSDLREWLFAPTTPSRVRNAIAELSQSASTERWTFSLTPEGSETAIAMIKVGAEYVTQFNPNGSESMITHHDVTPDDHHYSTDVTPLLRMAKEWIMAVVPGIEDDGDEVLDRELKLKIEEFVGLWNREAEYLYMSEDLRRAGDGIVAMASQLGMLEGPVPREVLGPAARWLLDTLSKAAQAAAAAGAVAAAPHYAEILRALSELARPAGWV